MTVYVILMIWLLVQIPLASTINDKQIYFAINNKRFSLSNALLWFNCLVLAFIAAFRANTVGTDTHTYNYWFTQLDGYSLLRLGEWSQNSYIEIGIGILAKLGKLVFKNNHGAWLVLSLVMFWALYQFIKVFSYNYAFSLFLFLCFGLFNQFFNISAQFIAATLLLASLVRLKNDSTKQYFLFLALAIMFHRSAIIGLILFPMYKMKKNAVEFSLLTVLAAFILSRFASQIVPYIVSRTIYSHYLYREVSSESGVGLIMNISLLACLVYFYKDMHEIEDNSHVWVYAATITVSLNFFIGSLGMISRLMVYFKMFYLVSIPCLSMAMKKRVKSKLFAEFANFGIIVLFCVYYLYSLVHTTCFDTVPYIFEWF